MQDQQAAIGQLTKTTLLPSSQQYPDYAYYKEIFAGRPMPFAYLDLDLLAQNIQQVVARAGG